MKDRRSMRRLKLTFRRGKMKRCGVASVVARKTFVKISSESFQKISA